MKNLIVFLKDAFPTIDLDNENLLESLDSFEIFTLVAAIEEKYKISIPMDDISPENFNSKESINALICKLLN